jgi:selT/selW/selH-like putative selenoprotein
LQAAIIKAHPSTEVELIPGSGGTFLVHADGKKVWDKLADDSGFPEETELVSSL